MIRKKRFYILVMIFFCLLSSCTNKKQYQYIVTSERCNIYAKPSRKFKIMGQMKRGTLFFLKASHQQYSTLEYNAGVPAPIKWYKLANKKGYVWAKCFVPFTGASIVINNFAGKVVVFSKNFTKASEVSFVSYDMLARRDWKPGKEPPRDWIYSQEAKKVTEKIFIIRNKKFRWQAHLYMDGFALYYGAKKLIDTGRCFLDAEIKYVEKHKFVIVNIVEPTMGHTTVLGELCIYNSETGQLIKKVEIFKKRKYLISEIVISPEENNYFFKIYDPSVGSSYFICINLKTFKVTKKKIVYKNRAQDNCIE